jgi:hypothetical protein
VLAKPDPVEVFRGTLIPHVELSGEFLSILVTIIGTNAWPATSVEIEGSYGLNACSHRDRAAFGDSRSPAIRRSVKQNVLQNVGCNPAKIAQ